MPLYSVFVCMADPLRRAKPPWACNLVLITSRGQVTIPEATPAAPPQKGATQKFGIRVDKISKRLMSSEFDDVPETGTWEAGEAALSPEELCDCSEELLAAPELLLSSGRIVED